MDGRIIHITIDAGLIMEAKRRVEQKKQFAETCQRLGYSNEQTVSDAIKAIADLIESLHEEEENGTS